MWKRDVARRLLANSTQPDALRRDEINNGLIYLAQHKSRRRFETTRVMIFDVEFLLAVQQIASITGLPMTHARDRLTRVAENHLGNRYEASVSCVPKHVSGYDMAQMFHALVRESVGLSSDIQVTRHLVPLST